MKSLEQLHRDFGTFYPTGHMVVAFQQAEDAHRVMHDLEALEHRPVDMLEVGPREMADFAQKNLQEAGVLAGMGTSVPTLRAFLEAARSGATFLILPTSDRLTAEHVMQAIHHVPFMLAERYHRLAIETVH